MHPGIFNIEPTGEMLILYGDRETDLMQVAKRYMQAVHLCSNTVENLQAGRSSAGIFAIKRLRWLLNAKDPDKDTCRYLVTQMERLSSQRSGLADKMRMYLMKMENMKKSLNNMVAGPLGPFIRIYFEREMKIVEMTFVKLIAAFDRSELEGFKELNNMKFPLLSTSDRYIFPPLKDEFKIFATEEVYSKGMVIAAALKLYKAENGKYPENIEALVPKYLKTLPYDDFSIDRKFTYLGRGEGNVILYSLGLDGKDDGGKDFDFDTGTGDFVIINTKSPPSSEIQTGNLQPLWATPDKPKKTDKAKNEAKKTGKGKSAGDKKKKPPVKGKNPGGK